MLRSAADSNVRTGDDDPSFDMSSEQENSGSSLNSGWAVPVQCCKHTWVSNCARHLPFL